jgi:hypothetical protein
MNVIRCVGLFLLFSATNIFPGVTYAQDTSGSGSTQASSTSSASTSGNSTSSSSSQTTQTSGNSTAISADPVAAVQQQQQQLTQQFTQQLATATPDERVALVSNFQQQLSSLLSSVALPAPSPDQIAQQAAAQAAFVQTLPVADQQAYGLIQQRQQLAQQMAASTPDQRTALIGQIQNLAQQLTALNPEPSGPPTGAATTAQVQAAWVATLPTNDQAVMQALIQRNQAVQATMLLPPDQRVAALQEIQAQPLPALSTNTTTNSGNTTSNSTLSSPSTGQ